MQAAKALPEDEAVLENGERQGERGHPPGGSLDPSSKPAASPQPLKRGAQPPTRGRGVALQGGRWFSSEFRQ